jgi:hypothetical protein
VSITTITKSGLSIGEQNQCFYNGFDFGPEVRTLSFRGSPVYDGSGRTISYTTYAVTVEAPFSGPSVVAVQRMLEDARKRLSKPAGELRYRGREFGNLDINTSVVKDIAYGPKPGDLDVIPLGAGLSGKLQWSFTVSIPDCIYARYELAVSEFTFDVDYVVSRYGYTTRTISGVLKVANNRISPASRYPKDSADRLREAILRNFPQVLEFRRTPGRFKLSRDRSELTFAIVDEEFEGPSPPLGCLDATASHSIANNGQFNLLSYTGEISAEYILPKGANGEAARVAFRQLVEDRLNYHKSKLDGLSKTVIPLSYRVNRPNLYGLNKTSFSMSYMFTISKAEKLLGVSGLWRPVPSANWSKWYTSVQSVLGSRGQAQLTFDIGEDRITDLCDNNDAQPQPKEFNNNFEAEDLRNMLPFLFRPPKKDESWVAYDCHIEFQTDQGTVSYRSLPKAEVKLQVNTPQPDALTSTASEILSYVAPGNWSISSPGSVNTNQGGFALPPPTIPSGSPSGVPVGRLMADIVPDPPENKPPVIRTQQRTNPAVYIWLVGKALRAGYPVPQPQLEDVNGVTPVASNRLDMSEGFKYGIYGASLTPIYWGTWRIRYLLPDFIDGNLPMPKNPLHNPER